MSLVGVVVIGRNEGERLRRCLGSVCGGGHTVVYVDSGSTDSSVAMAREMRAEVVELNISCPFTAARARNAGFERLMEIAPATELVQFVDGDCEIVPGWCDQALGEMEAKWDVAVVCGHTLERNSRATRYNRLCALEWIKTPGEVRASGGIFMVRASVYREVGGMNPHVIAAEDDEFCVRVRAAGHKVVQLDADMVWHDAAMSRFSQWWRRAKRCGHAYAQVGSLHGRSPEHHFVRQRRSTWFWGLLVPVLALALAWPTRGWSLALLLGYALLGLRIYRHGRRRGWSSGDASLYAFFTVLGKIPQLLGMVEYYRRRWFGRRMTIIEYKHRETAS